MCKSHFRMRLAVKRRAATQRSVQQLSRQVREQEAKLAAGSQQVAQGVAKLKKLTAENEVRHGCWWPVYCIAVGRGHAAADWCDFGTWVFRSAQVLIANDLKKVTGMWWSVHFALLMYLHYVAYCSSCMLHAAMGLGLYCWYVCAVNPGCAPPLPSPLPPPASVRRLTWRVQLRWRPRRSALMRWCRSSRSAGEGRLPYLPVPKFVNLNSCTLS